MMTRAFNTRCKQQGAYSIHYSYALAVYGMCGRKSVCLIAISWKIVEFRKFAYGKQYHSNK